LRRTVVFGVAEAIIDQFEIIQIEHQQGGIFLPAVRGFEQLSGAPVVEAGQAVMVGE
jgi:hypothetical protein